MTEFGDKARSFSSRYVHLIENNLLKEEESDTQLIHQN